MSHLTHVRTQIKDPEALADACQAMGLVLERGGHARFFEGLSGPCDYLIRLPGRYDLGFQRQPDGTFALVGDEELIGGQYGTDGYGRGDPGRRLLGEACRRLKQEYAAAVLKRQAQRRGLEFRRQNLPNGEIKISLVQGTPRRG